MATSVTLKPNAIDISGTTSGTVTLQAPSVAGTTTLTLPSTSGTLLTSASTATTSTNLAGGSNGTIPYQSASGTTQMLAVGTSGQVLQTNGVGAPTWVAAATGDVTLTGAQTLTNKTLTAPVLTTPVLGTPSSGTATNLTGLPLTTGVTGTLPIANGGTNSTATATAGGIAYGTGTAIVVNSAGTAGQFLQSNGASAPSWVAASAGALTLLSTVTASSSATVDIETTFNSTYDNYMIVASGITCATSGILRARFKISGSYYAGGLYDYHVTDTVDSSTAYAALAAQDATSINVLTSLDNTANSTAGFVMYVYKPAATNILKQVSWTGASNRQNASSSVYLNTGAGGVGDSQIAALTGIRFLMASGNINAGTFRLYGIANS